MAELITRKELAEALGITTRSVDNLRGQGMPTRLASRQDAPSARIPIVGTAPMFYLDEVQSWLTKRRSENQEKRKRAKR
jgi:phage terminase Nu1 subunit (DNA packaging protein)